MKRFKPLLILFCLFILTPAHSQDMNALGQELELRSYLIFNKYYKAGERVKKKEFHNYLKVEDHLYYPFKMGKTVSDVGDVIFILSGTALFLDLRSEARLKAIGLESDGGNDFRISTYIGAGLGAMMHVFGRFVMKTKVTQYNQAQLTSLDFKVNQDGLGLVYSF